MSIKWNDSVRLIISDVDDTLAETYAPASKELTIELTKLLSEGKALFLISGQGITNIQNRIVNQIDKEFRKQVIVGICSGAEVWGFSEDGQLLNKPFYSLYEKTFCDTHKSAWRVVVKDVLQKFGFTVLNTMPKPKFREVSKGDPMTIMYEDRGPQITFELVNSCFLTEEQHRAIKLKLPFIGDNKDLRVSVIEYASKFLVEKGIPVTARLAGNFAIDFAIENVTKTTAVKYVMECRECLAHIGLDSEAVSKAENIEVWGDKYSVVNGGTDRHISEALPKDVRSIDFRKEKLEELPEGYNIVIWDGTMELCEGVLEYLKNRNNN